MLGGPRLSDGYPNALHHVVSHALVVPWRFERLHISGGVGRPAGECMFAWRGVPIERPSPPGEVTERLLQRGLRPATSTRSTGSFPDQARPVSVIRPGSMKQRREKKWGSGRNQKGSNPDPLNAFTGVVGIQPWPSGEPWLERAPEINTIGILANKFR
jgi:hypothetical protein